MSDTKVNDPAMNPADNTKQVISEEQGIQKEWYRQARKETLETLPAFLNHLLTDYQHDYGTICHALAAGATAAAWAMNSAPQGGITGFQGGAVMWQFIREWNYSSNQSGLSIVDYDKLIYPQYADKFEKTISPEIWAKVQELAQKSISDHQASLDKYLVDRLEYDAELAAFTGKYPDYPDRKEHYDRLGAGTGEEWAQEKLKEDSGFEFAPREPFKPTVAGTVMVHWQLIVQGIPPFGFQIREDS